MKLNSKTGAVCRAGLAIAAAAALFCVQVAHADVVPGDTFTFSIAATNSSTGFVLGSGHIATFGQTTTYTGVGYNGEDYTISSSEVVGATTTTDYFKITTPVNFLSSATVNGSTMTGLRFDIGTSTSGVGVSSGADAINFLTAISGATATGSIVYGTSNTVFNLTPSFDAANGSLTLVAAEGVNVNSGSISSIGVHEFNFSITYSNVSAVPEPGTSALMLAGLGVVGVLGARRSRKSHAAA